MISKLKIIQKEFVSKELDDDPIKDLQDETTDSNGPIVFARADATHFVFDDGDEGSQQKEDGDMTVNKKAFEDVSEKIKQNFRAIFDTIRTE